MEGGDKERWRLYGRSVKMESRKSGGESELMVKREEGELLSRD